MSKNIFLDALMVLFTVHITCTYLASFKKKSECNKLYSFSTWTVYILFQFFVMSTNSVCSLLALFGNVILVTVFLLVTYWVEFKIAVFHTCILYALWMTAEVVIQSILLAALAENSFAAGYFISTIFMYGIIQIYKRWKGRDHTAPHPFRHWIKLLLLPLFSMIITYYAYMTALHSGRMAFFYFLSLLIILINYLIFNLYDKMKTQALLERQNQAYEQEIHLCIKQAAEREEAYQQTRILRHDLKGRLVALSALLEAGQTAETQKEIKKMLKVNSLNSHGTAETGNLALDALVNYKYAAAAEESIQMLCSLEVPADLFVEGSDLCVILENLLDNAMEAVRTLPQEERQIGLTVQIVKDTLFIYVENPFHGEIFIDSHGKIQSSKPGDHGIGLLSVEQTAEKYGGEAFISYADGLFRTTVMLFRREILH